LIFLLDVNVLIALVDPGHVAHDVVHGWFGASGGAAWATSPTTENGLLRIVGSPRYPNSAGSPAAVVPFLASLRSHPGHRFWADDISVMDTAGVTAGRILKPGQMTDTYLLALAKSKGGCLATLDRKLSVAAVDDGALALYLIRGGN
jgi:toxin-antitoxin system PIN domain toxin